MAADQGIIDSVSNSNLKTVAEAAAFYAAQGMANSVQSQNRLNILAEQALAVSIKNLQTVSPEQAMSDAGVAAAGLPPSVVAMLTALAAGQQGAKVAQTTPPETGKVA